MDGVFTRYNSRVVIQCLADVWNIRLPKLWQMQDLIIDRAREHERRGLTYQLICKGNHPAAMAQTRSPGSPPPQPRLARDPRLRTKGSSSSVSV